MNDNPILYMFIGLPAAGKSTESKKIEDYGIVRISSDDKIEAYAKSLGKSYNDVFHDYVKTAEGLIRREAEVAINYGQDVVWDQTNLSRAVRTKKLNMFPAHYKKSAIVVSCSDEDHQKRLLSRPGKVIPPFVIESMKRSYEEPTFDEGFDTIVFLDTTTNTSRKITKP